MEESTQKNTRLEPTKKYELYSKSVKAGKRTYFFDVRKSQNNESYIVITESKKCFQSNGTQYYEKHKIFLYPEDIKRFSEALSHVADYVKESGSIKIRKAFSKESIQKIEEDYISELDEQTIESYSEDLDFNDLK